MPEPKQIRTEISPDNIIYNLEHEQTLKENRLLDFDRVMSITEIKTVKRAIPPAENRNLLF